MAKKAQQELELPIPQTLEDVEHYEEKIRECLELAAVKKEEMADLKHEADLQENIASRYCEAIYLFACDHPELFADTGKQEIHLPQGGVLAQVSSTRLIVSGKVETIIKWLKRHRLTRFVRVGKETLNKKLMHEEPEQVKRIPGVRLGQAELFTIYPRGQNDYMQREPHEPKWTHKTPDEEVQTFAQAAE